MTNPLHDRAVLAQLTITQWSARKHDKKVSKDAALAHSANQAAGRYHKSLLPMNSCLEAVHSSSSAIRGWHDGRTLPWEGRGVRMLPSMSYLEYTSEFNAHRAAHGVLVQRFIGQYETARQAAPFTLGNMYDANDYPALSEVVGKFSIDLVISAVPATDFRCLPSTLPQSAIDEITRNADSRLSSGQAAAERALWERLLERVENIVERTGHPDHKFHNSLFDGAEELCLLLPKLNFNDDQNLVILCNEVRTHLCKHAPEVVRADLLVRSDVNDSATRLVALIKENMPS